jgi:hypothetical protein
MMIAKTTRFMTWIFPLAVGMFLLVKDVHSDEHVQLSLNVEQTEITVGDVVRLMLRVTHPAGEQLVPVQLGQNWGALEIRSVSAVQIENTGDGTVTSSQAIEAILWAPGSYETPELMVSVLGRNGEPQEFTVLPATIRVDSVLVEGDDELRDIKPQATMPIPALWPWIAGSILLVGLLLYLLRWLVRRRRGRKQQFPEQEPERRPAYLIALEELARIESMALPSEGRYKTHYTLVTDVIRQYLEGAFHVPAMDLTTYEIGAALKPVELPRSEKKEVVKLLAEADLVKFAKVVPEIGLAQQFPQHARRLVEATRPRPPSEFDPGETPDDTGGHAA